MKDVSTTMHDCNLVWNSSNLKTTGRGNDAQMVRLFCIANVDAKQIIRGVVFYVLRLSVLTLLR